MSPFPCAKGPFNRLMRPNAKPGSKVNAAIGKCNCDTAGSEDTSMDGQPTDPFGRVLSSFGGEHIIHITSVSPGPVWPEQNQLLAAYGYAIRLRDGTYTRLIPSDQLQEFKIGVPARQQSSEGLIILPSPELTLPGQHDNPAQYVTSAFVKSLPLNRPKRPSKASSDAVRIYEDPKAKVQDTIDSIVAKNPIGQAVLSTSASKTPRRQKTFCDKWIHEGVCAFTQLGCKYKHEMPMDKATQVSLGLNHGLPSWYKRQSVHPQPETQEMSFPGLAAGPWLRPEVSAGVRTDACLKQSIFASPPAGAMFAQANFGPVGRPGPSKYQQSSNPFVLLPQESDMKANQNEIENHVNQINSHS